MALESIIEERVYLDRLANEAKGYDEAVSFAKHVISDSHQASMEQMQLFVSAFKKANQGRVEAWRVVSSAERKQELFGNHQRVAVIRDYKRMIEDEISANSKRDLAFVDTLSALNADDDKPFYYILKGDLTAYLAVVKTGSDRKQAIENALSFYKIAKEYLQKAIEQVSLCMHPIEGCSFSSPSCLPSLSCSLIHLQQEYKTLCDKISYQSQLREISSASEAMFDPTKYRTRLCKRWLETKSCRYGEDCRFAHGEDELRSKTDAKK